MSNISPTIKVDISIKPNIVEEISLGAACSPEEITYYKALSPEYRDISGWPYSEMPGIIPSNVEKHIDTWHDAYPGRQKQCQLHLFREPIRCAFLFFWYILISNLHILIDGCFHLGYWLSSYRISTPSQQAHFPNGNRKSRYHSPLYMTGFLQRFAYHVINSLK